MRQQTRVVGADGSEPAAAPASPLQAHVEHMSDLEHQEERWLSRQEAAELLVDIAYTLTAGGPLELTMAGRRIKVPVANELRLGRELKSNGDRVELDVELTWSSAVSAAHRSRSD